MGLCFPALRAAPRGDGAGRGCSGFARLTPEWSASHETTFRHNLFRARKPQMLRPLSVS